MSNKNTDGLDKFRKQRLQDKLSQVHKAIEQLYAKNEVISLKKVAQISGVSRQFIYNNGELVKKIKEHIPQSLQNNRNKIVSISSARSHENKIKALVARCKKITAENEKLRAEIQSLHQYIEELTNG